jgi:hypothetical protein
MNNPLIVEQPLTVIALIAAIVSMVLSSIALWPQWKHGLSVVRDLVLWAALVFVVVMVLNVRTRRATNSTAPTTRRDVYQTTPDRIPGAPALQPRGAVDTRPIRYAPANSLQP